MRMGMYLDIAISRLHPTQVTFPVGISGGDILLFQGLPSTFPQRGDAVASIGRSFSSVSTELHKRKLDFNTTTEMVNDPEEGEDAMLIAVHLRGLDYDQLLTLW